MPRHGGRLRRLWITLAPRSFARFCAPDDLELGLLGEELAARELERGGWEVLAKRARTAVVEVDLVAREEHRIVLVEVKTQRAPELPRCKGMSSAERAALLHAAETRWRPGLRLDRKRLERLARAARGFRVRGAPPPRVDLVEVWVGRDGIRFEHHKGRVRPLAE